MLILLILLHQLTFIMTQTVSLIAKNIKHFRDIKNLSQKEICADSGVPQGQYSRI